MKLSTKGRYGMRVMLDLALHSSRGPVLLKHIAARQDISLKYLEQLVIPLKRAGLIKSLRGARGGYILNRPPAKIKSLEIIEALEGPLGMVDCVVRPQACTRANICVTRELWEEMHRVVEDLFSSTTLQDLVVRQKQRMQKGVLIYNI